MEAPFPTGKYFKLLYTYIKRNYKALVHDGMVNDSTQNSF